MNTSNPRYYGDSLFASRVLQVCTVHDLIRFFEHYGLFVTELSEGRIYPATLQSSSVVSILLLALELNHVSVKTESSVDSIGTKDQFFFVSLSSGQTFYSRRIIVSTGGAVQPKLGGSADGYQLLQSMGHSLNKPFPSLVPVITDKKSISGLSGIRVHCEISLFCRLSLLHQESGELLFTDYGISGICVMQCSRFIIPGDLHFEIDFMSRVFSDIHSAFSELCRRRKLLSAYEPVCLLEGIVPKKVSSAILRQADISLSGITLSDIGDRELKKIMDTAYHYHIQVLGTKGMDFAQVTAGGINCAEFNPVTMESLLHKGIYATGEVLNVDGDCGGYNLMFAFASGIIAGRSFRS